MKKRYIATAGTIGIAGIGMVANYLLKKKHSNHYILKDSQGYRTLEDAGIPGQLGITNSAQLDNSNMVYEGSQYGVNYYNEVKEAERYGDN